MNKEATQDLLNMFEEKLKRYREQLRQKPDSVVYDGLVKNTEEFIEELKEQIEQQNGAHNATRKTILVNEATSTDLKIIRQLESLGWTIGDTLLYQQEYKLTDEQQKQFPNIKSIKPDIILQDLN